MSKVKAVDYSSLMSETKSFKKVLLPKKLLESVIYGIVFFDEQKVQYDKEVPAEFKKLMKILVEFPGFEQEDGAKVTLGSKYINCTNSDKGNLIKLYAAATGLEKVTPDLLKEALNTNGLSDMLGKRIGSKIDYWGENLDNHKLAGLTEWPDTGQPVKLTNKTFVFHPRFPDMKVWKESLGFFVKKDIMASVNASEFPKELHDAWAIDQEENKKRQDEFAAKKEAKQADVGDVI